MGNNASQLEKEIGYDQFPANEHYFGLVNFGNTCYCNSVLQALYFCRPFREKVLDYKAKSKRSGSSAGSGSNGSSGLGSGGGGGGNKETLLTCLADLFHSIATQKKKTGTIPPKKFITRLRKENEVFDNYMQQDAHEFLNYLLNTIADLLVAEKKAEAARQQQQQQLKEQSKGSESPPEAEIKTWVHDIFQGTLTNETRCLNCESLSSKDEDFLDLSVDVDQNTSITQCLRVFSNTETLSCEHKYYCENCCSKQEAQKRMRIKRLPMILALHLKRFKYTEAQNRHTKLSYRVVFPLELRIFNKTSNEETSDRLYDLVAVVIHCGSGPNRGHYISIVKSFGFWLLFDDDIVEKIDPANIEDFYGLTSDTQKTSESGYILFYQCRES
ncbi:PREDICTED: ubiquitin carboxyl-terminal hydrolase 46-like [Rhagoletis zephyria]|uniref:ubiquitin carboxyl-terminal hydrolase 46-like n=1 Tax=Rhagoletis zephyria TaxID=28612 RepID=UPI00081156CB|nr:PREDICTED: ubiquitin carboxyl-terminal hydrolase 46-like [Rhagoletis zephyria]